MALRLGHRNAEVRDVATLALQRMADKDDPAVIAAVAVHLEHADENVRKLAIPESQSSDG